jgi:uncharacterized membrane protein
MYPKSRIDALTDGIFAVAMTILVLDLRLPDALAADEATLTGALKDLEPKFLPYALSFYVLGSAWLANIKLRSQGELMERRYVSWWLFYLLIATCLPFSSSVVGRFPTLQAAVWLYAINMATLAGVGYRLMTLLPGLPDDEHTLERKVSLGLVIATSVLCVALSVLHPGQALFVYVLNFAAPMFARWTCAKRATP